MNINMKKLNVSYMSYCYYYIHLAFFTLNIQIKFFNKIVLFFYTNVLKVS